MVSHSVVRRTQSERSADTTRRILEATLTTLAEHGYRGTTTTAVARAAGVSRGAMLHHFPNRNALLAAAAEWMVETRVSEFRAAMAGIDDSGDRIRAAIDLLWTICSSSTHLAWTELALAARNEPGLTGIVSDLEGQIRVRVRETWSETFPELQDGPLAATAQDFAFSLLEGLALRQLLWVDTAVARAVVDALKEIAAMALTTSTDPPPTPEVHP